MALSVRTCGGQLRTVMIPVLQTVLGPDENWIMAQQSACGADAQPPMILMWPDTAVGFPEAVVHGNTATIPATIAAGDAAFRRRVARGWHRDLELTPDTAATRPDRRIHPHDRRDRLRGSGQNDSTPVPGP